MFQNFVFVYPIASQIWDILLYDQQKPIRDGAFWRRPNNLFKDLIIFTYDPCIVNIDFGNFLQLLFKYLLGKRQTRILRLKRRVETQAFVLFSKDRIFCCLMESRMQILIK